MWKLIGNILKAVGIISGAAGALWIAFNFVDNTKDQTRELTQKVDRIIYSDSAKMDRIISNDSVQNIKIDRLIRSVDMLVISNNNLREYMMNHASTTDELLEVLDIWEEKKNGRLTASDKIINPK